MKRRRFLKLGLFAGAAGAAGVAVDHLWDGTDRVGLFVTGRERRLLQALLPRLLVGDAHGMPDPNEVGAVEFLDRFLGTADAATQADVHELLAAVEHLTPVTGVGIRPFTKLSSRDQERHLRALETSSLATFRTIASALKSLAAMAYYRDPRTWDPIGYSGPLVQPGFDVYGGKSPPPVLPPARPGTLEADVVVIGTGAGGLMAAAELASAGVSVIALEEGEHRTHIDFDQREDDMVPALFQDRGGRTTEDLSVRILQGRGVGGSTVHNTNLCKRAPAEVLDRWQSELGLAGVSSAGLAADYAAVERELGVEPIAPDRVNCNNRLLQDGAAKLGLPTAVLSHNRKGCIGSGFCELGCSFDAKQNALKVLLPRALAGGARVVPRARAVRILWSGRRATGVEAELTDERGRRSGHLVVRARAVCLAGSAVGSAALALASGLPDPEGHVGHHLRIHPAVAIAGVFDERVQGWIGIPQSVECTGLLDFRPGARNRTWILPAFAHPVGAAALMPGVGAAHARTMRSYAHTAVLTAVLHDESEGSVAVEKGRLRIRYALDDADRRALARGVRACGEILLAAGARRVLIPTAPPLVARSKRELGRFGEQDLAPLGVPLVAVHPMGTLRMSRSPAEGVVDAHGRHHRIENLFVCDSSLFPTSIGGPPQISIYALARRVARAVRSG